MINLSNILFGYKLNNRRWYHIIGWWEIRRIPYNLIVIFSGISSIFMMSLVVNGVGDFIHPLSIIGFAFLANLFYTGGWIGEIAWKIQKGNSKLIGAHLYKIGLLVSIFFTFLPALIFAVAGIIKGEKISSPYSHFAEDKPDVTELYGVYRINPSLADIIEDEVEENALIILKDDSSFEFIEVPVFEIFSNFKNYTTTRKWNFYTGTGNWTLEKTTSFNSWCITFEFYKEYSSDKRTMTFFIYNNSPPFKLYDIIDDPDSWSGILYEKQESKQGNINILTQ